MNKNEIQKRVLKNGKPLNKDLFTWHEKTKTFSSHESGLVIDFADVDDCTIVVGYHCTIDAGSCCIIDAGSCCIIDAGSHCAIKVDSHCTIVVRESCDINSSSHCTIVARESCVVQTKLECVLVRRDIYQLIELVDGQTIKLNEYGDRGYEVINDNNNNRKIK